MTLKGYTNQQVYGAALLERLARSPHAGALKKETQVFKAAQGVFEKATDKVAVAQGRRDDIIDAIGTADDGLDTALLAVADRLVGAGLGQRRNPFASYSEHSPSRITGLAYADETKAAQKLVTALQKKKLPTEVAAATKVVATACAEVQKSLKALAAPQADYEAAMQARDALLLDWHKALGRLKRAAAFAYDTDKAGYRALFAPAQDLQLKKRPPTKKKPAPPAP